MGKNNCIVINYCNGFDNEIALSALSYRVNQIENRGKVILRGVNINKKAAEFAEKNGWKLLETHFAKLYFLLELFNCNFIIFINSRFPFFDSKMTNEIISDMKSEKKELFSAETTRNMVPEYIIESRFYIKAVLRKIIGTKNKNIFKQLKKTAEKNRTLLKKEIKLPRSALFLDTNYINQDLINCFGGVDISINSIIESEKSGEININTLFEAAKSDILSKMELSDEKNSLNRNLMFLESRVEVKEVNSFPYDVALNLTTLCNANCSFCNYSDIKEKCSDFFSLDLIKNMKWLAYIDKLGFGGGVGDPLVNKEFKEIFQYILTEYPHIKTRIITNGIGLNSELNKIITGTLSKIRISLNSSTSENWKNLMGRDGFEAVCRNIKEIAEMKKEKKTALPEIILLMTVSIENIEESSNFVKLAHNLGAQSVAFNLFDSKVMPQAEMKSNKSLYYNKEIADREFLKAKEIGKKLGIKVEIPPLFSEKCGCFEGTRSHFIPEKCYAPWETCMLAVNYRGERNMSFCCVGMKEKIEYSAEDLRERNFLKLWNNKTLQYFRESVNTKNKNHVCNYCRISDSRDPGVEGLDEAELKLKEIFRR